MINKQVLDYIANQKIGVDKRIDIARGLHKFPSTIKEWVSYIKFTYKYGRQC
jgi:hypothetical protein